MSSKTLLIVSAVLAFTVKFSLAQNDQVVRRDQIAVNVKADVGKPAKPKSDQESSEAIKHAKMAGVALVVYASEHQGMLPTHLADLSPNYVSDFTFFNNMLLLNGKTKLAELPKKTVILLYTPPVEKDSFLILIHADLSSETVGK